MDKTRHIDSFTNSELTKRIKKRNSSKWLPTFHISPPFGLLNDPNGLSYINNQYHIFFQWYPGGPAHGLKHWFHLTSSDLIKYKVQGVGVKPTTIDKDGAFSGSYTLLDKESKILYTSNIIEEDVVVQRQIIAEFNGREITNKKLLIDNHKYTTNQFRDPSHLKINGRDLIFVGAQRKDLIPVIAVYEYQNNNVEWLGELEIQLNQEFEMIECPQIFKLKNQYVLIISPQGLENGEYQYQSKFNVVYATFDDFDFNNIKLIGLSEFKELDFGHDFYAPQIMQKEEEKILYAWAGCGKSKYADQDDDWMNILTIPRKIEVVNGKLTQTPHSSIYKLIKEHKTIVNIEDVFTNDSSSYYLKFTNLDEFRIRIGDEDDFIQIFIDEGYLILDRSTTKRPVVSLHSDIRKCKLVDENIEIFIDKSVIEIFVNSGKNTITSRFFVENCKLIKANCKFEIANLNSISLNYEVEDFEN